MFNQALSLARRHIAPNPTSEEKQTNNHRWKLSLYPLFLNSLELSWEAEEIADITKVILEKA